MSLVERFLAFILQPFVLSHRTLGDSDAASEQHDPIKHLTDSDIIKLWKESSKIDAGTFQTFLDFPNPGNVGSIGFGTVVKRFPGAQESQAMVLVRKETTIPVPLCYRSIDSVFPRYLAMSLIEGQTLASVWDNLGLWMRFRVVVSLWHYVYQLRSISRRNPHLCQLPGPFGGAGPERCTGSLFNDSGAGPFRSYAHMAAWYRNRLLVMQRFHPNFEAFKTIDPFFDDTKPLVFTHQDLHMRNLILGKDGQLWVIDWDNAGFYPEWFEGANMREVYRLHGDSGSWNKLNSWIFGKSNSRGQWPYVDAIRFSLVSMSADIPDLIGMEDL
ncbi:uncharacterized protein EV420DRAFT_1766182 [Desarmillaria tabescens]|uniref:Aminoglycoside phosphotransferase domain-containing protein n=1 Tax=Armillaria tabescens TaxID=1929756 RepID=A0AA39MZS0_ARMTA|nr:uncharacterized protein EV420DRAFT_1766182 [Desarmillaria tabescens]KAK0452089.1 hypothetical protein EV420DRAFT_1766182 [Desarmillaria tabescens]